MEGYDLLHPECTRYIKEGEHYLVAFYWISSTWDLTLRNWKMSGVESSGEYSGCRTWGK